MRRCKTDARMSPVRPHQAQAAWLERKSTMRDAHRTVLLVLKLRELPQAEGGRWLRRELRSNTHCSSSSSSSSSKRLRKGDNLKMGLRICVNHPKHFMQLQIRSRFLQALTVLWQTQDLLP